MAKIHKQLIQINKNKPEHFTRSAFFIDTDPIEINFEEIKHIQSTIDITPKKEHLTLINNLPNTPYDADNMFKLLKNTVVSSDFFDKDSNFGIYKSSKFTLITDINVTDAIKSILILIDNNYKMYHKHSIDKKTHTLYSSKFLPQIYQSVDNNLEVTISQNKYNFLLKKNDKDNIFELYLIKKSKMPFSKSLLERIVSQEWYNDHSGRNNQSGQNNQGGTNQQPINVRGLNGTKINRLGTSLNGLKSRKNGKKSKPTNGLSLNGNNNLNGTVLRLN
jgi:hypothetical protein